MDVCLNKHDGWMCLTIVNVKSAICVMCNTPLAYIDFFTAKFIIRKLND